MLKQFILFLLILLQSVRLSAQPPHAPSEIITDTFCKTYDLTSLLVTQSETGTEGVFDSTYWRIHVHFETITKDEQRPETYHIQGAFRTMKHVVPIEGEIHITRVKQYDRAFFWVIDTTFELPPDVPYFDEKEFRYTYCTGSFEFRESNNQVNAGVFSGKLDFGIHENAEGILLDDLQNYQPDGYSNFIYKGIWKNNTTGSIKPFIWGEGRIPLPPGVDVGFDAFQIARQYRKNGWQPGDDPPKYWWK
jgi:hypothetical protein